MYEALEDQTGTNSWVPARWLRCLIAVPALGLLFVGLRHVDLAWSPEPVFNIFLARHCDKNPPWSKDPTTYELCTEEGLLRGEHLAKEFGPGGAYPMPNRLYARRLKKGFYSSRDLYLLWPLAQRLGLVVNTSFSEAALPLLVQALEQQREAVRGEETVLVSWDHCSLPALAQALGCELEGCSDCWDDGDFERILWLRFTGSQLGWSLESRVVMENFSAPKSLMGYRECLENPVENSNFGYKCTTLPGWKSLAV